MSLDSITLVLLYGPQEGVQTGRSLRHDAKTTGGLIEKGSLAVYLSRDYLDIDEDNVEGVVRIRDQLSNVFTPQWRTCGIRYPVFESYVEGREGLPRLDVITDNKTVYNNLDYFLHLSDFKNKRRRMTDGGWEPIPCQVATDRVYQLGRLTLDRLIDAGYDRGENGPVPGWVFQKANDWLSRMLDLYRYKTVRRYPKSIYTDYSRDSVIQSLNNPVVSSSPFVDEDLRNCIIDSYETRVTIYENTLDLLRRIDEMRSDDQ